MYDIAIKRTTRIMILLCDSQNKYIYLFINAALPISSVFRLVKKTCFSITLFTNMFYIPVKALMRKCETYQLKILMYVIMLVHK